MLGVPRSAILEESARATPMRMRLTRASSFSPITSTGFYLVTSAMTMPRALAAFRHQGIDTIAAPADFTPGLDEDSRSGASELEVDALNLLPIPHTLDDSSAALHEYMGLVLYRLAGWI